MGVDGQSPEEESMAAAAVFRLREPAVLAPMMLDDSMPEVVDPATQTAPLAPEPEELQTATFVACEPPTSQIQEVESPMMQDRVSTSPPLDALSVAAIAADAVDELAHPQQDRPSNCPEVVKATIPSPSVASDVAEKP